MTEEKPAVSKIEPPKEPEKKKLSPFAVVGGAVASVVSMLIGSLFGDGGTLVGAASSSVVCSVGAYLFESSATRAQARLVAKMKQQQADEESMPHPLQDRLKALPLGEQALIDARTKRELHKSWSKHRRIAVFGTMLGVCLASTLAVLFLVEGATGKTLTANTTGKAQYGTTLGGYSTQRPSPAYTPSSTPTYSSGSGGPTAASVSPSSTPSATYTPSATVTPFGGGQTATGYQTPSPTLTPQTTTPPATSSP